MSTASVTCLEYSARVVEEKRCLHILTLDVVNAKRDLHPGGSTSGQKADLLGQLQNLYKASNAYLKNHRGHSNSRTSLGHVTVCEHTRASTVLTLTTVQMWAVQGSKSTCPSSLSTTNESFLLAAVHDNLRTSGSVLTIWVAIRKQVASKVLVVTSHSIATVALALYASLVR